MLIWALGQSLQFFSKRPLASDYRLLPPTGLSKGGEPSEEPVAAELTQVCSASQLLTYTPLRAQ